MSETLVLGANGFVGSHLVDALVADGHNVRAFDRFGSKEPVYDESENVEMFVGDYLNRGDLKEALEGIDHVFHFISTTTPITAENDPVVDIETNIRMSVELFQLCVEQKVKGVVFASTGGAIYGNSSHQGPLRETDLAEPISPYGIGKLTIENYLRYFRSKHNLASTALRISNPYGERQPMHRKQGVIPIFLDNIYNDKPLTVFGDGSMIRDYIYVKDVAQISSAILSSGNLDPVYNLGSGQGSSINNLIDLSRKITGKDIDIEHREVPATFVNEVVLDNSRLTEKIGAFDFTDLEVGMRATYDYIKRSHEKV
ncbi:MAG: hypothetical protein JWO54_183 [Candidatus Saccharibacteria bacterium]|nr:hypothetical protein [Candidatus Saccharibacteria bacterium]